MLTLTIGALLRSGGRVLANPAMKSGPVMIEIGETAIVTVVRRKNGQKPNFRRRTTPNGHVLIIGECEVCPISLSPGLRTQPDDLHGHRASRFAR